MRITEEDTEDDDTFLEPMSIDDDRSLRSRRKRAKYNSLYINLSLLLHSLLLITLVGFFIGLYVQYSPIILDTISKYWDHVAEILNMIPNCIQLIKNSTELAGELTEVVGGLDKVIERLKYDLTEAEKLLKQVDPSFHPK